ncbi:MAG: C40 family peptidase [Alphaproteobacteria bacterium]|nr:C40 family peptidase [Alphaproteobacteria bacterium]
MNIRKLIVKEARSWIGTKFHHQGRVKKSKNSQGGCDCLGLVIKIADALHLKDMHGTKIKDLDEINYSSIPDGDYLYKKLTYHFKEKDAKNIKYGDVALFSFKKHPQHLGIIGEQTYAKHHHTLIHAYSVNGYVCEHILDKKWHSRLVAVFTLV